MNANRTAQVYELRDELARYCLPRTGRDPNRKLAWTNSICILFLIIGIVGAKPGAIRLKAPPPLPAEMVPIFVEPPPPPPQQEQAQQEQPKDETKTEAPQVVVAVPDSPAVAFSVPTIANVLMPNGMPTTPPLNPMQPVESMRNDPVPLTAGKGDRPDPVYPEFFQARGEHGSVGLLITADESGRISGVQISQSTGFPRLDEYTADFVKKHWRVPAGGAKFKTTITYVQ